MKISRVSVITIMWPPHHVGEKTDAECGRLCEDTEHLYHLHDGERELQQQRHIRPEYLFPVMLCSEHVRYDESAERQNQSHSDIAGKIGSSRENHNQTREVHHENEEEHGEKVRRELAGVVTKSRLLCCHNK